jgi:hypothetical protein
MRPLPLRKEVLPPTEPSKLGAFASIEEVNRAFAKAIYTSVMILGVTFWIERLLAVWP